MIAVVSYIMIFQLKSSQKRFQAGQAYSHAYSRVNKGDIGHFKCKSGWTIIECYCMISYIWAISYPYNVTK